MNNVTSGAELRKQSRHLVRCPETGNVYLMRRPNVAHLINAGVLPENFVAKTLSLLGKEQGEESKELTDKDLLNGEGVMQAMLKASMLKPRIVDFVDDEEDADVTEFYDIPPEDRTYLFRWAKGELPDVPLETVTGDSTTVGAVESFPSSQKGSEPTGVSTNGKQTGKKPVRSVRAA